jgi:hypothetical protein
MRPTRSLLLLTTHFPRSFSIETTRDERQHPTVLWGHLGTTLTTCELTVKESSSASTKPKPTTADCKH